MFYIIICTLYIVHPGEVKEIDCGFIHLEAWSYPVITMAKPPPPSTEGNDPSISGKDFYVQKVIRIL